MRAFLDFEASSLARDSVPIEVAWVFEDGISETYLIRPAPGWNDWSALAESVHRIPRDLLLSDGIAHDTVARRMLGALEGHDLFASSPTWDGKWLSILLRAAGLPRHALRLRDTDAALSEGATEILRDVVPADGLAAEVAAIMTRVADQPTGVVAHRALPDARQEHQRFLQAMAMAGELRAAWDSDTT